MHQMNSRDKKSVKSNFESNIILGKVRQMLNGKDLKRIDNGMTALLSRYKIKGLFACIFGFMLNSFHLTQLTRFGKASLVLFQIRQ